MGWCIITEALIGGRLVATVDMSQAWGCVTGPERGLRRVRDLSNWGGWFFAGVETPACLRVWFFRSFRNPGLAALVSGRSAARVRGFPGLRGGILRRPAATYYTGRPCLAAFDRTRGMAEPGGLSGLRSGN